MRFTVFPLGKWETRGTKERGGQGRQGDKEEAKSIYILLSSDS
ncbi:hypothetical protein [Chroococcidiopsis sp. CCNUC1]|nr:hypothetical protein [Chroococcidiopsis sp. CCNUC1]